MNEEITLTDQSLELALHINSALHTLDADGLVDAVSRFMRFHGLAALPDNVAEIPVSSQAQGDLDVDLETILKRASRSG